MIKALLLFTKYSSKKISRIFYLLQILIIFNSIFQLISVVSVAPLVALLSNYNIENYAHFEKFYILLNYFNIQATKSNLLIIFSGLVLFVFVITNILTAIVYSLQQIISQMVNVEISGKVVKNFFSQKSSIGIKSNSYYFKTLVEKEVDQVISHVVTPLADLNGKIFPLIMILLGLIYINPTATFLVFIFLSFGYLAIYLLIKRKLNTNSKYISTYGLLNVKIVDDLFKSFKESKIFNFENYLINNYLNFKKLYSTRIAYNLILHGAPRHFFEIIAIVIVISIIYYFSLNSSLSSSLPILAIYIVAGYKIMPILQSILFAISNIRGAQYSLNNVFNAIKKKSTKKTLKKLKKINTIKIQNLDFSFSSNVIFKNTNIEFKKNFSTGILGESGTGKSTLIDILSGFKDPKKANFFINNNKVDLRKFDLLDSLSLVPQNIYLMNEKLIENITFKKKINNEEYFRVLEILKKLNLKNFYSGNKIINRNIKEFGKNISGGQIQRLGIARAMFKNSNIIVLDEFTSSLDRKTEKLILNNLNNFFINKIVIIISHQKSIIDWCKCAYEIQNKKLIKIK
jgi:ATP-binding cassette, subfamily B, bacterial PglK